MLQIGDRVRWTNYGEGEVVIIRENSRALEPSHLVEYGVRFDRYSTGMHDLSGACKVGHGYWLNSCHLEIVEPQVPSTPEFDEYDQS